MRCLVQDNLFTVKIRKSVFLESGVDGDFGWMIQQPEFARSLFVFNDNESQFNAFHEGKPSGLSAGGGNAIIRPYQGTKPQRAAGIPTGDLGGYSELSPQIKQTIDRAIDYIKPRKFMILMVSILLGGAIGTSWVFARKHWAEANSSL